MNTKDHINNNRDWEPDHKFMCRKGLWTLREAAHNLFNIVPYYVEEVHGRYFEIIKLYEIMDIDIELSILNTYERDASVEKYERVVKPGEFIKWAKSKGYQIPEAFRFHKSSKKSK